MTDVIINERVAERLRQVLEYIERMEFERQGYSQESKKDVEDTRRSFNRALSTLLIANEIWIDGGEGFSFGGNLNGIIFGMIARPGTSEFSTPPIEWSFHS